MAAALVIGFLLLVAVTEQVSLVRTRRQCPCAPIVPNSCTCSPSFSPRCTCMKPILEPSCGCALPTQISQCRASCQHTCITTCARSKFSPVCPSLCGYTCSQSCAPRHAIPLRVVMPRMIAADQCLPVCQHFCGRSCEALFPADACASVCAHSCEQRCMQIVSTSAISPCSPACIPECSQQCIREQQLLQKNQLQFTNAGDIDSIQNLQPFINQPMPSTYLDTVPQQLHPGRETLLPGSPIGGLTQPVQLLPEQPMLIPNEMMSKAAQSDYPRTGHPLPMDLYSQNLLSGSPALPMFPGMLRGGPGEHQQLLENQPSLMSGPGAVRGIPPLQPLSQPSLIRTPPTGGPVLPQQIVPVPNGRTKPISFPTASLPQPFPRQPIPIPRPMTGYLPQNQQLLANQQELTAEPSDMKAAFPRQPFIGQPSFVAEGLPQLQQLRGDQTTFIPIPIAVRTPQPQQLATGQLTHDKGVSQQLLTDQLANVPSTMGEAQKMGILPEQSTLISEAPTASTVAPPIRSDSTMIPVTPTIQQPIEAIQPMQEQELLSQQASQASPSMAVPAQPQNFGNGNSYGKLRKA